jgi:cellobiose-specific phosphotransferase system component IIA
LAIEKSGGVRIVLRDTLSVVKIAVTILTMTAQDTLMVSVIYVTLVLIMVIGIHLVQR